MTSNITNTVNNNTIIVCNDKINIYSLYFLILRYINNFRKELERLRKELDIVKGGPPEVQAIDYEKVGSSGNKSQDINDIYKKIKEIVDSIRELEFKINNLKKSKKELEDTFYEVARIKKDDLELKVFIGVYIEKKSLRQLSHELYRLDYLDRKKPYSYQYLREIHVKIKKNLQKCV